MDRLRLDLGTLEVERLDVAVTGLNGGLESFRMGHASTELSHSCTGKECNEAKGACGDETACGTDGNSSCAHTCLCD